MTVRENHRRWGVDPGDRWVMVRAEICAPALWHADGMADLSENLPPIPLALARRIEAFAARYDDLDDANVLFPRPHHWEERTDFPVPAFNEEGRAIARALKAALPPDWTVVYEDVDAWLRPKGLPIEARQVILPGERSPEAPHMTQSLLHADLKDKQRRLREGFATPLNLRVHRALSWLGRAEAAGEDRDVRFILLWIGFNAAYAGDAQRAAGLAAPVGERDAFRGFFETLLEIDRTKRIYNLIWQRFSHEIRLLLDNQFVFAAFWAHHNGVPGYADWPQRLEKSRTAIGYALRQQDTATILSILFDRLYVLRNQLVHGGATWDSDVNRGQVRDGAALLGCLLPVFIDLMMDAPGLEWPMPHYPVV